MPREESSYRHFRLECPACHETVHCRTLPILRPATLMVSCPTCRNDICLATCPDGYLDGTKQQNGIWAFQLLDLIYLEDGLTEQEGDRLLWANKHTLEERIAAYRQAISQPSGSPAENAE